MKKRLHASQEGFNLVEVLIAMAILGVVMLSVVTLFFMGRSNVYAGKQLTRATSVSTHASEDLSALPARDFFDAFKIDPSTTTSSNSILGVTYANSIIRSTADLSTDANGYLARWLALLGPDRVSKGKLTLIIMPSDYSDPADVTTARLVQIRILTQWNERNRARNVYIDTTKFNRSLQ